MEDKTWKFYVAGVQFHQLKTCIADLAVGDSLELKAEPTNKYDPNAVAIIFRKKLKGGYSLAMLGYVPAKISAEVSAELSIADDLICEITNLVPSAKPWQQLEVIIGSEDAVRAAAYEKPEGLDDEENSDVEGL